MSIVHYARTFQPISSAPFCSFIHMIIYLYMQDYKRNAYMEAELRCSNAIQIMERKLRSACHASDANLQNAVKVSI